MSNLLDKASIILTPTAYNNGKALCVKPSDGSGDFQFQRNSAATRVNAQGLVENVQILSSNLVQNGNFSEEGVQEVSNGSFSQEGVEQITNGDFSNGSTGWDLRGVTTVYDDKANTVSTSSEYILLQNSVTTIGKQYKITYDLVVDSGTFVTYYDTVNLSSRYRTTSGTYTEYFEAVSLNMAFRSVGNFTGSITNVSCVEVAQDWTLGTGWSIGEDKATSDGSASNLDQSGAFLSGKTYKVVYDVLDYVSGDIRFRFTGTSNENGTLRNANGTYTEYIKLTNTQSVLRFPSSAFNGSITNISVKEVGQNWDIVSANASIGENKLIANSVVTENIATQSGVVPISKPIILKFDLILNSGGFRVLAGSGGTATNITTSGTYTLYETSGTGGTLTLQSRFGSFEGSVTNLSIIEITTDTNLPRINYEGFSYQDALGSELVVNGDFATDSDWSKDANWSIANGVATSNGFGRMFQSIPFLENNEGTKVKVSFDITENTNGGVVVNCYGSVSQLFTSVGTHTFVTTTTNSTNLYFNNVGAGGSFIGSIDNVSVKEYLGQEVVPDSGCGSWLWEPQSTNLITYSNDYSQWNKGASTTISPNYAISPDGTQNATRFQTPTGGGTYLSLAASMTIGSIYTLSLYLKNNGGENLDIGVATSSSVGAKTASIEVNLTSEWVRYELSFTADSNSNFVFIDNINNANAIDCLVWGAQLEQQSYATSYIPTNGEANGVTRNQDVCNNGATGAGLINSTEGVLYAEIKLDLLTSNMYIQISDNSYNNRVALINNNSSNSWRVFYRVNGISQIDATATGLNVFQTNKIAISWKLNEFKFFVNGTKIREDNSGIVNPLNTFNRIDFSDINGTNKFFGKTKALAVWKEALSDSELQSLTTI